MNAKLKLLVLPLIIACVTYFAVGLSTSFSVKADPLDQDSITGISVTTAERFNVSYKVSLPNGYQSPSMTFSVNGEDEQTVTDYTTEGETLIFTFNGVDFLDIDKSITATLTASNPSGQIQSVTDDTRTVQSYFETLLTKTATDLNMTEFEYLTLKSYVVSVLNFSAKLQILNGQTENLADATLTDTDKSKLLSYDNVYSADKWPQRDNHYTTGEDATGFTWGSDVGLEYDGGYKLKFRFTVNSGTFNDLSARIYFAGQTYAVTPELESSTATTTTYKVLTSAFGITDFSSNVGVQIYNADQKISRRAEYSVNKAIAFERDRTTPTEDRRAYIESLFVLAKSSTIFAYASDNMQTEFLSVYDDEGALRYFVQLFDYANQKFMGEDIHSVGFHRPTVQVGNTVYTYEADTDEIVSGVTTADYTVKYDKSSNTFNLTLNGGEYSGIISYYSNLKLTVNGNSTVLGSFYKDGDGFDNMAKPCTIGAEGALEITGISKLSVLGSGLDSTTLTVTGNVTVDIKTNKISHDGIRAEGDISITGGATLSATYVGQTDSTANGLYVTGNVTVDGASLSTYNYKTALMLDGTVEEGVSNQTLYSKGDTTINLVGKETGVTSKTVNRLLNLDDGEILVTGETGITYMDITLNKADLKVVADYGKAIGYADTWGGVYVPTSITTTSGDYKVGSITVENYSPSIWGKVCSAVYSDSMQIDGGTLKFASSGETVFEPVKDGVYNYSNCNVYFEGLNVDLTNAEFTNYGINADVGGVKININVSARLFIKNVVIAAKCYGETACTITVDGGFDIINYRNEIWEWGGNKIEYASNNYELTALPVRYTNKIPVGGN